MIDEETNALLDDLIEGLDRLNLMLDKIIEGLGTR